MTTNHDVFSYGRTKLGNNLFAREIAKRHLADTEKPILAISVHPGTVDTDVQGTWSETYGFLGKILKKGSSENKFLCLEGLKIVR